MNFEDIKKDYMKENYAKQITEWNYDGNYSSYNLPSYDVCVKNHYGITQIDKQKNYVVYTINDEVIFYFNMKLMDSGKVYIGVGLKPEYCGKGFGNYFLNDSVKLAKEKYPNAILFLEVRSWNKRAIKSYEKIGFKIVRTVISKDRQGNNTEFVEMEKA